MFLAFGAFFVLNCAVYPLYYSCNSYYEAAIEFLFIPIIYISCCLSVWLYKR